MAEAPRLRDKRLTAMVDEATYDEVTRLATALGLSRSQMLGILIGIAVRSSGATIEQFGDLVGVFMPEPAE